MNRVLIGIHGKPRAGKDTVARHLVKEWNLLLFGPSMPVKAVTAVMFDVGPALLYDDKTKDTIDPYWNISYREMMQKVGKECSRDVFGEDFWMRHVDKNWQKVLKGLSVPYNNSHGDIKYRGMVLADIRYDNEISWVKQRGGLVIFVTRENRDFVANEKHAAEQGLPLERADVIIPNNGTVKELYQKLDYIVEPLVRSTYGTLS